MFDFGHIRLEQHIKNWSTPECGQVSKHEITADAPKDGKACHFSVTSANIVA